MFGETTCTYCGQRATTLDHVVPVIYTQSAPRKRKRPSYSREKVVPACAECNSLLSSIGYFSISERANYLIGRISRRHKKTLSMPSWTEDDLIEGDIQGRLKGYVVALAAERETTLKRIEYLNLVAAMPELKIQDVWTQIDVS